MRLGVRLSFCVFYSWYVNGLGESFSCGALDWLMANASSLAIDLARIGTIGDSVGVVVTVESTGSLKNERRVPSLQCVDSNHRVNVLCRRLIERQHRRHMDVRIRSDTPGQNLFCTHGPLGRRYQHSKDLFAIRATAVKVGTARCQDLLGVTLSSCVVYCCDREWVGRIL